MTTKTKTKAKKSAARKPAKKTAAKKTAKKKTAKKKTATKKKPSKKTATKKRATKLARRIPDPIPVDGTHLDVLLDLAGGRKQTRSRTLETLEQQLGRPVPGELRTWFTRPPDLDHPDADNPDVSDTSFAGELPDVSAWLAQLRKPYEGTIQAIHQLVGACSLGAKLERGDFFYVFAALDRYSDLDTGGAVYWDGREMGGYFPGSLSGFLRHELEQHWQAHDAADGDEPDLRDVFWFSRRDPLLKPPEAAELPGPVTDAWAARAEQVTARFERADALLEILRGRVPPVASLPTEAQWLAERAGLADHHADAMYWLLAHWLLDNGPELADAVDLTRHHPSPLVAALREHVVGHPGAPAYGPQRAAVFDAVRRAAAG